MSLVPGAYDKNPMATATGSLWQYLAISSQEGDVYHHTQVVNLCSSN